MTKAEAKKWAYGVAADLIRTDMDMGEIVDDFSEDADELRKKAALAEVIAELERRSKTPRSSR